MKKNKEPKPRKKALIAQYEVRIGKKGEIVDFGKKFEDVMVIDMFSQQTLAWNIAEAKKKMGLSSKVDNAIVIPYIVNTLLIEMQETDWEKVNKLKKKNYNEANKKDKK